jgi:SET domain-containing protein
MSLLEHSLVVKRSTLPRAGKGLFTRVFIPKNTIIAEYRGKVSTWKEVNHGDGSNGYLYYVNRNLVIDAKNHTKSKARYANDARGFEKIKGILNNSVYVEKDGKVYIQSKKDIPAGAEIFVDYGREYWETMRYNERIERHRQLQAAKARA